MHSATRGRGGLFRRRDTVWLIYTKVRLICLSLDFFLSFHKWITDRTKSSECTTVYWDLIQELDKRWKIAYETTIKAKSMRGFSTATPKLVENKFALGEPSKELLDDWDCRTVESVLELHDTQGGSDKNCCESLHASTFVITPIRFSIIRLLIHLIYLLIHFADKIRDINVNWKIRWMLVLMAGLVNCPSNSVQRGLVLCQTADKNQVVALYLRMMWIKIEIFNEELRRGSNEIKMWKIPHFFKLWKNLNVGIKLSLDSNVVPPLEGCPGQSGDILTGQGGPRRPDCRLLMPHRGRETHRGIQEIQKMQTWPESTEQES